MKIKPVVGITSDYNGGDRPEFGGKEETCFIRARYVNAVEKMGGIPIILSPMDDIKKTIATLLGRIDGLLLTGSGPDIDPRFYGESKNFEYQIISEKRSRFEWALTEGALASQMPILGICSGMQLLNVMSGGSLYQDIRSEMPQALQHDKGPKPSHRMTIQGDTLLAKIIKQKEIRVNSSHHQGIRKLAPHYIANAYSDDGLTEGIEHPDYPFLMGVQWHPEYLHKEDCSQKIFKAFLKASVDYRWPTVEKY